MYKLHSLSTGSTNTQGVPLGLVNWMCLNRIQGPVIESEPIQIAGPPDLTFGYQLSVILWADLALTIRGVSGMKGFLTINALDWRRHNAHV